MTSGIITLNVATPSVLPSWVPAAGEVNVLTNTNGLLTNRFTDVCTPWMSSFYMNKVVNAYSGGVLNQHFGQYGMPIFYGGGHADTNDNTCVGLVLGENTCSFRRLVNGSPIFGTGIDPTTQGNNSIGNVSGQYDVDYYEYLIDNKPMSSHTWGSLIVLGPTEGGASHGSLLQPILGAAGAIGVSGDITLHQLDFSSATGFADGGTPSYTWARRTNSRAGYPPGAGIMGGPYWAAYVPAQNRVYIELRSGGAAAPGSPKWWGLTDNTFNFGTGAQRTNNDDSWGGLMDGCIMFAVPERNLVVHIGMTSENARIQYMDVSVSQPGWATATLGTVLPVERYWSSACWCPDNGKILFGGRAGDNAAMFEITIPADPNSSWTVERAPFGAGQTMYFPPAGNGGVGTGYKSFAYNPRIKAIVYMPYAQSANGGSETVWVYRPRGT